MGTSDIITWYPSYPLTSPQRHSAFRVQRSSSSPAGIWGECRWEGLWWTAVHHCSYWSDESCGNKSSPPVIRQIWDQVSNVRVVTRCLLCSGSAGTCSVPRDRQDDQAAVLLPEPAGTWTTFTWGKPAWYHSRSHSDISTSLLDSGSPTCLQESDHSACIPGLLLFKMSPVLRLCSMSPGLRMSNVSPGLLLVSNIH